MKRRRLTTVVALVVLVSFGSVLAVPLFRYLRLSSADRAVFQMDRRANLPIVFTGKVVDQDGVPVAGAEVDVELSALNENWAYQSAGPGSRATYSHYTLASDAGGSFQLHAKGTWLRIKAVRFPGHRWLYDEEVGVTAGRPDGNNRFFRFATDGESRPYQPDSASPALFVMAKDGAKDVRVKPSRGGREYHARDGTLTVNQPVWPYQPSLRDVHYVEPSTPPSAETTQITRE